LFIADPAEESVQECSPQTAAPSKHPNLPGNTLDAAAAVVVAALADLAVGSAKELAVAAVAWAVAMDETDPLDPWRAQTAADAVELAEEIVDAEVGHSTKAAVAVAAAVVVMEAVVKGMAAGSWVHGSQQLEDTVVQEMHTKTEAEVEVGTEAGAGAEDEAEQPAAVHGSRLSSRPPYSDTLHFAQSD
jgi:hypothetical protein